jgi:ketosteroid isomerase-like protein
VPHAGLALKSEADLARNTARWSAGLSDGDGVSAAAVYADDALLLPPEGDVISGRQAIERFWQSGIDIGLRSVELEPVGRGASGSIVYEHGHNRMDLAQANGESKVERGSYVLVHAQADGGTWHWAVTSFGAATA